MLTTKKLFDDNVENTAKHTYYVLMPLNKFVLKAYTSSFVVAHMLNFCKEKCIRPNPGMEATRLTPEAGADVNTVAEDGGTALQLAAHYKHEAVMNLLLEWQADPNLSSPLVSTVGRWTGTPAIALKLIQAGSAVTSAASWTGNPPSRVLRSN